MNIKSEALAEKDNKIESLYSELEGRKLQLDLKDDTIKKLNEELKLSKAKIDELTTENADLNQSLTLLKGLVDQSTFVNQSQIEKNRLADDEIKRLKENLADKEAQCASVKTELDDLKLTQGSISD